ncbi:THO complex subunit 4 [Strigomonas culicis]|uniref:THO complex subunit 4 n=1 Tax=Strigomonas culicis TaxID=28005 RepID=S9TH10_9TRYP|nr:THO complex subunit 4 [Strigomonas culicis]|eukprot:EPY17357.1 THO complex subunit 4 [Strigomonas culicis]
MASFTPLENPSDLKTLQENALQDGESPVGVVIDKNCRVYISNIPDSRIEQEGTTALRAEFEVFGPVETYQMFTERTGRFIGTALCTYRSPADARSAIQGMNDKEVDGAVLKVAPARDHGVVLLHSSRQGFLKRNDTDDGDKWSHDKYKLLAEGKEMEEVLGLGPRRDSYAGRGYGGRGGRGRGGRGRGGFEQYSERVEMQFEKYLKERDAELNRFLVDPTANTFQNEEMGDGNDADSAPTDGVLPPVLDA